MNFLGALLSQSGRPRGWLGRILARGMNVGHAGLTRWGLSNVKFPECANVLDIGCGGGRTLNHLASLAGHGQSVGIDHSTDAIAVAWKKNLKGIARGRVAVLLGSVSSMPFTEATFDLVTAVETYYFWPDIAADLAEVRRVMKPDGRLVIIAGMYRGSAFDQRNMKLIKAGGMRCFSVREFEATLQDAGFSNVAVRVEPRKGWIGVVSAVAPDDQP